MRFQKIKYSKDKVKIEYELKTEKGGWDQYSFACSDEPKPGFKEALVALAQDVITLCELPENYATRVMVTGVSLSYATDDEIPGATIISQLLLRKSNVNLNLNTPFKPFQPYSEGADISQILSEACVERVKRLMEEAEEYVRGIRAQGEMFVEKAKEDGLKKIAKDFHDDMQKTLGPGESVTISTGGKSATIRAKGATA